MCGLQVDSAKPRPPYTGAKYRVGRALGPSSGSRAAGDRFALDPIRHPQSEPPETGPALDSGSRSGVDSASCGFSWIASSEFLAEISAGVPAMLCPGVRPGRENRCDQTSLMRWSSKSRHSGMMVSRLSDQTTKTRSSRCGAPHEYTGNYTTVHGEPTYNKGSALFLVSARQVGHAVKDLDAGVIVDVNGSRVIIPGKAV